MLRLVWKDAVVARRLLLLGLPLYVLQIATFAAFGPGLLLAAFVFTGLLAFGSIAIEEMQSTDVLWCSLPLRRGDVVGARYLTTLVASLVGLGISWTAGQAATRLVFRAQGGPSPFVSLGAHATLLAFLLFTAAFFLPFYFAFGAGRGAVLFAAWSVGGLLVLSVVAQVALFLAEASNPLLDPALWRDGRIRPDTALIAWLDRWWGWLLAGWVLLAACALAVSAKISQRIYEKRDL
jgi:hypothetical protein